MTVPIYAINGLELRWSDGDKRSGRPCKKCGVPTQGRMQINDEAAEPAHRDCAIDLVIARGCSTVQVAARIAMEMGAKFAMQPARYAGK